MNFTHAETMKVKSIRGVVRASGAPCKGAAEPRTTPGRQRRAIGANVRAGEIYAPPAARAGEAETWQN